MALVTGRFALFATFFLLFTSVFARNINEVTLNTCGVSVQCTFQWAGRMVMTIHGANGMFLRRSHAMKHHATRPRILPVSVRMMASTPLLRAWSRPAAITPITIVSMPRKRDACRRSIQHDPLTDVCSVASFRKLNYDCDVAQPVWTIDPAYVAAAIIVFVIQTFFFGLRITARLLKLGTWGLDDTTCVAAYVSCIQRCHAGLVLMKFAGHIGHPACVMCTW